MASRTPPPTARCTGSGPTRAIPTPTPDQTYEAEIATLSGPVVATDHPGYTGSGFADYQHDSGDYVQWNVDVPADSTYTLLFRYANGGTTNRPPAVAVDGGETSTQPFATTGDWVLGRAQPIVVTLSAGTHIRLRADVQRGGFAAIVSSEIANTHQGVTPWARFPAVG